MNERVSNLLPRLAEDLAPTGLKLEAGVFDLASGRWLAGTGEKPSGFGDGYVMVLPGRQHLVRADPAGGVDLLAIVDDVRDWAIDELGHGWPEMLDDSGVFIGLLGPVRDGADVAWALGGRRVAVGQLSRAPIALPPSWDLPRP